MIRIPVPLHGDLSTATLRVWWRSINWYTPKTNRGWRLMHCRLMSELAGIPWMTDDEIRKYIADLRS